MSTLKRRDSKITKRRSDNLTKQQRNQLKQKIGFDLIRRTGSQVTQMNWKKLPKHKVLTDAAELMLTFCKKTENLKLKNEFLEKQVNTLMNELNAAKQRIAELLHSNYTGQVGPGEHTPQQLNNQQKMMGYSPIMGQQQPEYTQQPPQSSTSGPAQGLQQLLQNLQATIQNLTQAHTSQPQQQQQQPEIKIEQKSFYDDKMDFSFEDIIEKNICSQQHGANLFDHLSEDSQESL